MSKTPQFSIKTIEKKIAYSVILLGIILFALWTRLYNLQYPAGYYFDEVYHSITAQLIAKNDPRAFEWWHPPIEQPNVMVDWLHPPLAKYTQAIGILVFGNTEFGWRISSAVFGTGVIFLTYVLGKQLFSEKVGLISAFLASMDGLLLAQSRITMNDIHVTFFALLTLVTYRWYRSDTRHFSRFVLTAIIAGCALASKWSGLFVIAGIGLTEVFLTIKIRWNHAFHQPTQKKEQAILVRRSLLQHTLALISLAIIPVSVYIASYGQAFLQGKDFQHLYELHQQIWWYQTNLDATHAYQSRPIQWFFNTKPVWYHVEYKDGVRIADIYAEGNHLVHWMGSIALVVSLGAILRNGITTQNQAKKPTDTIQKLAWLVALYAILWIPWQFSPRIMFYYHYAPAVPLLAICIGYWLGVLIDKDTDTIPATLSINTSSGKTEKHTSNKDEIVMHNQDSTHRNGIKKQLRTALVFCLLLSTLVVFVLWYPRWTGISLL